MSKIKLKSRVRSRITNNWRCLVIDRLSSVGITFGNVQPKNAVLEYLIKEHRIDVESLSELRLKEREKIALQREATIKKDISTQTNKVVIQKSTTINKPISIPKPIGYKQQSKKTENIRIDDANEFYKSWAWKDLRLQVIKKHGRRCMCCGASPSNDNNVVIHVDHIKPIRIHPELALDINNLQVLCESCNMGKGFWDETDFSAL